MRDQAEMLHAQAPEVKFTGSDPIEILDFLAVLANTADLLYLAEDEAFNALPRFLAGRAATLFNAARRSSSTVQARSVCNWPTAVQFLLRRFASNANIQKALEDLREVKQNPGELENDYLARFERTHVRAGSPWEMREKLAQFIEGLDSCIRSLVHRCREQHPHPIFSTSSNTLLWNE